MKARLRRARYNMGSSRAVLRLAACVVAISVSGCVASGKSSPTDLASVLTPDKSDLVQKDDAPELSLVPTDSPTVSLVEDTDKSKETETSGVKTALVKATASTSAAENAVEQAAAGANDATDAKNAAVKEAVVSKPKASPRRPKTAPQPASAEDKSPQPASAEDKSKTTTAQAQDTDDAVEADKPKGFFARLRERRKKNAAARSSSAKSARVVQRGGTSRRRASGRLPGVRSKSLFGIEDDVETEELDGPVEVAAVTNLARRGTHGLLLQRSSVRVGCFPRRLIGLLKRVERRFGRTPVVTSGYRSRRYNRLVRGARNSTHTRCLAADIQVKGVSKWTLAKYLRSLPGRGGVGTYCHTKSVHIDVGSKRAWHHCRSRKRGRKRRT